jgi:hypothetical protein
MYKEKPMVMRDDLDPQTKIDVDRIKDCFLIALVKRNGGEVELSVDEVDRANDLMTMTTNDEGTGFILKTTARN